MDAIPSPRRIAEYGNANGTGDARRPLQLLIGASVAWGIVLLVLAAVLPIVTLQSLPAFATAPAVGATAVGTAAPAPQTPVFFTSPRVTLVQHDGSAVLLIVAIPLLAALAVGALLWIRDTRQSTAAGIAAWVLSAAVLAAAVVGFVTFLIGIAVVPIGVLLVIACVRTAPARHAGPA